MFDKGTRIIIYGAGNTGKDVLKVLQKHNHQIEFFIDQKGGECLGIPVYKPEQLKDNNYTQYICIIAIHNFSVNYHALIEKLSKYNFARIFSFMEFHKYFGQELGDRYWLTADLKMYDSNKEAIQNVKNLLCDEESKNIFSTTIKARNTSDISQLPLPKESVVFQYFSSDIPLKQCKTFVDAGAFDGDSISGLLKRFNSIDTYIAFEPDSQNFKKLSARVHQNNDRIKQAFLYPCGLFSETSTLFFKSDNATSSAISSENEGTSIQVTSLDEILVGVTPDYIKMDIEGAELAALQGAQSIIKKHKPNLAICLYHKPQDIFEIPMLIDSWNLGYKFYMRQYCYMGFDLVLYCV